MKNLFFSKIKKIAVIALSIITMFSFASVFFIASADTTGSAPVSMPLYSVSGKNSSVRYGTHEIYAQNKSGIVVNLAAGEKFRYEKAVNLNGKKVNNLLIGLFPTPKLKETSDAHYLSVTFTDVYDEDNYFTVTCWDSWQDGWGADHFYMSASPQGQFALGKSSLTGKIEGNGYGTEGLVSFSGQESGKLPVGSREIEISMDYSERQIFGTKYTIANPLVCDLDDTDYFDVPWTGFTTGEAFITIEAGNYNTATFDFVITYICGDDLSQGTFVPERKPEIEVDVSDYENGITTLTGKTFELPACSVVDIYDSNVSVNYEVYYGSQKIDVSGKSFVPQNAGEYKAVYTVTDKFGNSQTVELLIEAVDGTTAYPVFFNKKENFKTGEVSSLAENLYFGGVVVGKPQTSITATLYGCNVVYDINPETLEFIPEYSGEYVIRCEYFDNISSGSKIYTVRAAEDGKAYIYDNPVLPSYFIKGARYSLPKINAYVYTDGTPSVKTANIFVSEDGGAEKSVQDVYNVKATDTVKVIYRYGEGALKDEKTQTIKVVDVNYGSELKAENYFFATKGEITRGSDENRVYYSSKQDFALDFINTVQGKSFTFEIGAKGSFSDIVANITDSVNPSEKITLRFNCGSVTTLFINGSSIGYKLSSSMTDGKVEVNYDDANKTVKVGGKTLSVKTTASGKAFNGFGSSMVKFDLEVNGVSGDSELSVYKINNQAFYDISLDGDLTRPELIVNTMRGEKRKGEKVTVYPALVKDVLDPYVVCTVSVLKPDGSTFATALDGTLLQSVAGNEKNYEFVLDEDGSYLTVYEVKDGYGNKLSFGVQNVVVDMDVPELTVKGVIQSEAIVGAIVNIADAEAKDNGKEIKVFAYIEAPDGMMYSPAVGGSFKASLKGVYKLTYFCVDDAGNMTYKMFKITVR